MAPEIRNGVWVILSDDQAADFLADIVPEVGVTESRHIACHAFDWLGNEITMMRWLDGNIDAGEAADLNATRCRSKSRLFRT